MSQDGKSQLVTIAVLENAIEAQLIGSILDQRGISHRLRSYYDTAYDGLFQLQKGWGEIFAPEEVKEEILDIMALVRSEAGATEDGRQKPEPQRSELQNHRGLRPETRCM